MMNASDYGELGLTHNPFISIPPIAEYEEGLRPLFSARDREVRELFRRSKSPNALFIVAPYGGGKTVVILEALSQLREHDAVTAYAQFESGADFRVAVHKAFLASDLPVEQGDSFDQLRKAIGTARRGGSQVVLAVDDLDRAHDIAQVYQVTHDIRDLLSAGAVVFVTGQPFGVTSDLHTSAGGLFHEVLLPEFSFDDFTEMQTKYLRSAHIRANLEPSHPFATSALEFICREAASARLTPRLHNFAVSEILEHAVGMGVRGIISLEFTVSYWPRVAERVVKSLRPEQIKHLQVILEAGHVSEDQASLINKLGGSPLAEYADVREAILLPLLEKNLVQNRSIAGKQEFSATPQAMATMFRMFSPEWSPSVRQEDVIDALKTAAASSDHQNKGQLLEHFAKLFFESIPGFRVPLDGMRVRTADQEIDLVVEVPEASHHHCYGTFFACECKNWTGPIADDALIKFVERLKDRSCIFGVFIALNGVTPGFRSALKKNLRERLVIALLTAHELSDLHNGTSPSRMLERAYFSALKFLGER
jgi:hypothetical protein